MSSIAFDTFKYAQRLKEAGVPLEQAEAEAAALSEAMREVTECGGISLRRWICKRPRWTSSSGWLACWWPRLVWLQRSLSYCEIFSAGRRGAGGWLLREPGVFSKNDEARAA